MIYVPVEVNTGAAYDDDGVVHDDDDDYDGDYGDGDDNDDDYDDDDDNDMFLLAGLERSTLELLKEDEEEPKCLSNQLSVCVTGFLLLPRLSRTSTSAKRTAGVVRCL